MTNTEIGALRAKLAARPRSDDYRLRRKDIDGRGLEYGLAPDVAVERTNANGVRAEWNLTPSAARDAVLLYLHGGGFVIGSLDSHPRCRAAAASLRLVHLTLGRPGGTRRDNVDKSGC